MWGEPGFILFVMNCAISFQLTRPVWGEPRGRLTVKCREPFQLTRPVWGEPGLFRYLGITRIISTHSPRVGRTLTTTSRALSRYISTHSPRVGRTLCKRAWNKISYKFQLTRPVWGEPLNIFNSLIRSQFQLTRPVWGEPQTR